MAEPKRYTLAEIAENIGPDGEWLAMAIELRSRLRLRLRSMNATLQHVPAWNFDTYVTDPYSVRIGDNCITFLERDSDRDLYETDLPFAIADGSVSMDDWIQSLLAEIQEKYEAEKRRIREKEMQHLQRAVNTEKQTLRRLVRKYPTLAVSLVADEDEKEVH